MDLNIPPHLQKLWGKLEQYIEGTTPIQKEKLEKMGLDDTIKDGYALSLK
jgi:hypothetical protein